MVPRESLVMVLAWRYGEIVKIDMIEKLADHMIANIPKNPQGHGILRTGRWSGCPFEEEIMEQATRIRVIRA